MKKQIDADTIIFGAFLIGMFLGGFMMIMFAGFTMQ